MALASAPEIARRCKWQIPRVLTDKLVGVSLLRHFTHSSRVLGLVISIVDNKCDFVILICDVSWTPDVSSADSWRPRTFFAISSNDIPLINAVFRQYSIFWLLSYKTRKHAHQWRLLLLDINKNTRARSVPNNDTCHARVILADLNFCNCINESLSVSSRLSVRALWLSNEKQAVGTGRTVAADDADTVLNSRLHESCQWLREYVELELWLLAWLQYRVGWTLPPSKSG